jgi:hypothetical protein
MEIARHHGTLAQASARPPRPTTTCSASSVVATDSNQDSDAVVPEGPTAGLRVANSVAVAAVRLVGESNLRLRSLKIRTLGWAALMALAVATVRNLGSSPIPSESS